MDSVSIRPLAESALLLEFPDLNDREANAAALGTAAELRRVPRPGVRDAIPGARTLLLRFDPRVLPPDSAAHDLESAARAGRAGGKPGKLVRFAVSYGGASGPDLPALAAELGLAPEEVARRHASSEYRVAFLGFAPGFAYLGGLPPELEAPRLPTPRPRVSAGSVALAAAYTGVYPGGTPGGWRLIGATGARLFDEASDPPALLEPGDAVRFDAAPASATPPRNAATASPLEGGARPLFRVIRPGGFTSVQGAPRDGIARFGVPPGGAMDPRALAYGNAALGNAAGAPALEITFSGPELEVVSGATVCVSGADVAAVLGGVSMVSGQPREVRRGDRLEIGRVRRGVRAYLCVAGGLASPGRLGITRRLEAGDRIGFPEREAARAAAPAPVRRSGAAAEPLRVILDPRAAARFAADALAVFTRSAYRISATSDRRGVRLEGEPLGGGEPADLPPEGTELGTIQVPADGQPIVLGPDRPVTGGYRKLGSLAAADWGRFARCAPGEAVRFRLVPLSDALDAGSSIPWL